MNTYCKYDPDGLVGGCPMQRIIELRARPQGLLSFYGSTVEVKAEGGVDIDLEIGRYPFAVQSEIIQALKRVPFSNASGLLKVVQKYPEVEVSHIRPSGFEVLWLLGLPDHKREGEALDEQTPRE